MPLHWFLVTDTPPVAHEARPHIGVTLRVLIKGLLILYTHAKIIAYKLSSENSFYSKCKILGSSQGINQEILVAMPVLRLGLTVVIWCDLLSFNQSGYDGFCTVA